MTQLFRLLLDKIDRLFGVGGDLFLDCVAMREKRTCFHGQCIWTNDWRVRVRRQAIDRYRCRAPWIWPNRSAAFASFRPILFDAVFYSRDKPIFGSANNRKRHVCDHRPESESVEKRFVSTRGKKNSLGIAESRRVVPFECPVTVGRTNFAETV